MATTISERVRDPAPQSPYQPGLAYHRRVAIAAKVTALHGFCEAKATARCEFRLFVLQNLAEAGLAKYSWLIPLARQFLARAIGSPWVTGFECNPRTPAPDPTETPAPNLTRSTIDSLLSKCIEHISPGSACG